MDASTLMTRPDTQCILTIKDKDGKETSKKVITTGDKDIMIDTRTKLPFNLQDLYDEDENTLIYLTPIH